MHAEVFEIQRDTLGLHVFEMEDTLRTHFEETQSNLVNLGIQRMDVEVNLRVIAAVADLLGDNPQTIYRHYRHRVRPVVTTAAERMERLLGDGHAGRNT